MEEMELIELSFGKKKSKRPAQWILEDYAFPGVVSSWGEPSKQFKEEDLVRLPVKSEADKTETTATTIWGYLWQKWFGKKSTENKLPKVRLGEADFIDLSQIRGSNSRYKEYDRLND